MDVNKGPKPSAAVEAITRDLGGLQKQKRRHFAPALALAMLAVVGVLAGLGLRPDLLAQPPWQLCLQGVSWIVCLLLFPAVGVGLWFPGRGGRIALAVGGVSLAIVAALGWPADTGAASASDGPCPLVLLGCGVVLLSLGALSGAFAQRRARSATFWVASGVGLAALSAVTWVCPEASAPHVLRMHLAPAVGVVAFAALIGAWLHRPRRR